MFDPEDPGSEDTDKVQQKSIDSQKSRKNLFSLNLIFDKNDKIKYDLSL
jgi:hypothetical protein